MLWMKICFEMSLAQGGGFCNYFFEYLNISKINLNKH